jgi:hypothetical protein
MYLIELIKRTSRLLKYYRNKRFLKNVIFVEKGCYTNQILGRKQYTKAIDNYVFWQTVVLNTKLDDIVIALIEMKAL